MNRVTGTCHCGAVKFTAPEPRWLTDCNCSICRRLGCLWAHFSIEEVKIEAANGATNSYVQGDRMLAMHTCLTCGCTTHWTPVDPTVDRMSVNFRMCDPEVLARLPVRRFDGAESWQFLDPEP